MSRTRTEPASGWETRPRTLVDVVRQRAAAAPDRQAFVFLANGEEEAARLTFDDLDRRARAIASHLQAEGFAGERAVLLYPAGLEFITAFIGCLYAGVVAVPAYPPRARRGLGRLGAILTDSRPALALGTASILARRRTLASSMPSLTELPWVTTDEIADDSADLWSEGAIEGGAPAFLQYTSGSTSTPRGVEVDHDNLLHNEEMIRSAFEQSEDAVVVGWLPLYHDMGLIGNVIQPLYVGATCVLMSPLAFLQQPARWLAAISRYRGTTSGGPNFAYELCVQRVGPEVRAGLDLSSWRVAFDGAEPVRAATLERFASAFADCGFRREAFYPCYGLAEATLFVTGGAPASPPVTREVDTAALEAGRAAEPSPGGRGARHLVGCGRPWHRQEVAIVDPQSRRRVEPGLVGEIWVRGPSVARGYWGRPGPSARTFTASLAGEPGAGWLRTGDLGFLAEEELFVTGRIKDLIILRGRNLYPQDIELTCERSDPRLRASGAAAFTVEEAGEERLVVAQEVERGVEVDADDLAWRIRRAVVEEHEVHVQEVVLLAAGTLPKTSSGKVARHACRHAYHEGTLRALGRSRLAPRAVTSGPNQKGQKGQKGQEEQGEPGLTAVAGLEPEAGRRAVVALLRERAAAILGAGVADVDPGMPVARLGLDSLMASELQLEVERRLGVPLSIGELLEAPSLGELGAEIFERLGAPPASVPPLIGEPPPGAAAGGPLSYGQKALWFLERLGSGSGAYNIAAAARVRGELDREALQRALAALSDRHSALRTTFADDAGQPVRRVLAQLVPEVATMKAAGLDDRALSELLGEAARRPFDLESGPPLRVTLVEGRPGSPVLLLVVHHLVGDFWSLAVILEELGRLYDAEAGGEPARLEPLPLDYGAWVDWQHRLLESTVGEELWRFWQERLGGELPPLDLPLDRPRPPQQTFRGDTVRAALEPRRTAALHDLAHRGGATFYTTLLAAFTVLLHRWSHQDTVIVGSPAAGRTRRELARLVGYFVNPLVFRADLGDRPTWSDHLERARHAVADSLSHQDLPFALLAERLHPVRDASRSPLFQVMFSLLDPPPRSGPELAAFALGEDGGHLRLGRLELESMSFDTGSAQFDLTLMAAEIGDGLSLAVQYNRDLFDRTTAERLLGSYRTLLEGLATGVDRPVDELPLLTPEERQQLLTDWNATAAEVPPERCVHELFEAQAAVRPEATALVFEDRELSFSELDRAANRLAHHLRAQGVGPGRVVGVHLERSPSLVVALLAVLKAGAAYLPLDPRFPGERLRLMLEDAAVGTVVCQVGTTGGLGDFSGRAVLLDAEEEAIGAASAERPPSGVSPLHPAYVIYTSGSTGRPKGVVVPHSTVVNFFVGMDRAIGCGPDDTLLAATSVSFDISVLELLWTLARGCRVVLLGERSVAEIGAPAPRSGSSDRPIDLSLFYFASSEGDANGDKYRLLLEGAKFADRNGFAAVWTPERHFHDFGALYPDPAVTGAALSTLTERIEIRAGSVVLPLHHPIRVAESWSVIDNLCGGRAGVAFASGWHADDFVFHPEGYERRKELLFSGIETVRRLWRGESVPAVGGGGNTIEVRILPRPPRPEIPIWVTTAGNVDTFITAGQIGANVLTHLLGQSLEEVAEKIVAYRRARREHGHDPASGIVTLMLHTFVGESRDAVLETVREPFTRYLGSSLGLIRNLVASLGLPVDLETLGPADREALLEHAFERYFETSALFGDAEGALEMVERVRRIGVDEIACLIDFGVPADEVLASLPLLARIRERARAPEAGRFSLTAEARRHRPSLFQGTPSLLRLLAQDERNLDALGSLEKLLVGGEALPRDLADQLTAALPARLFNVYGPTETTVWSTVGEVEAGSGPVSIGRPIANTEIHVLDRRGEPVPPRVIGEVSIGGDGVTDGYLGRPRLTAERFVPDPSGTRPGGRLYRTGDLGRWRVDGTLELLGRVDRQVKVRGFRIEPGEVEAALAEHPDVAEAAVIASGAAGEGSLLAYWTAAGREGPVTAEELRAFLADRLPDYMVPSRFVPLTALPRTPNGKLDRRALPRVDSTRPELATAYVAPADRLERGIAAVWAEVLGVDQVGVDDNFFDIGGHSLRMVQVHTLLRERLGVELPLVKLLEHPKVRSLARYLGRDGSEGFSVEMSRSRAELQRQGRLRSRHRAAREAQSR